MSELEHGTIVKEATEGLLGARLVGSDAPWNRFRDERRHEQAPGEHVENDIEQFISRRAAENQRARDAATNPPSQDAAEQIWKESERRHEQARLEQLRQARIEFHEQQSRRIRTTMLSLVERHEHLASHYRNMTINVEGVA